MIMQESVPCRISPRAMAVIALLAALALPGWSQKQPPAPLKPDAPSAVSTPSTASMPSTPSTLRLGPTPTPYAWPADLRDDESLSREERVRRHQERLKVVQAEAQKRAEERKQAGYIVFPEEMRDDPRLSEAERARRRDLRVKWAMEQAEKAAAGSAEATTGTAPGDRTAGRFLARDDFATTFGLKWEIVHPDPTHYSMTKKPGSLTMTTQRGTMTYDYTDYKNLFLTDPPPEARENCQITILAKDFAFKANWNQAAILFWADDSNYFKFSCEMDNYGDATGEYTYRYAHVTETAGQGRFYTKAAPQNMDKLWLRIVKKGNDYQCLASTDGQKFDEIYAPYTWTGVELPRVGLWATNGRNPEAPEVDVSFDYFELAALPADAAVAAVPRQRSSVSTAPVAAAGAPPRTPTAPSAPAATPARKFEIPAANLRIPDEAKACGENLRTVLAAIQRYQKDKGDLPAALSDLVPGYLPSAKLLCPDDPSHRNEYLPDPKLPCSYSYEFATTAYAKGGYTGRTPRQWKQQQVQYYGEDIVPIVRCLSHLAKQNVALNLTSTGWLYTSRMDWEFLFPREGMPLPGRSTPAATAPAGVAAAVPSTVPAARTPSPVLAQEVKPAEFAETRGAKKVFEGKYLHRSRGADYMMTLLTRYRGDDGRDLFTLSMRNESYLMTVDAKGKPVEYRVASVSGYASTFTFTTGETVWKRKSAQKGDETFRWKHGAESLPDFNSRPDPYLIQNVLIRHFDFAKGGKQTFKVFDIDGVGTGIVEYDIALELKDQDGVELPNGKFKARHIVQIQETGSGTWYKKARGSQTEYWVNDDGVILRVYRHREPYELILQDYDNPKDLIAAAKPVGLLTSAATGSAATAAPVQTPPPRVTPRSLPAFDLAQIPGELALKATYSHGGWGLATLYVKKMPEGKTAYIMEMDRGINIAIADARNMPLEYRYLSREQSGQGSTTTFVGNKVITERTWSREGVPPRSETTVSEGALPDFNSRPDPYCIQHILLRHYDMAKGGKQQLTAFDGDAKGAGYSEYKIEIENVGDEDFDFKGQKVKVRHLVLTQLTPSNTWYKKYQGLKTDFYVGGDWTIYRIFRAREPYEVMLQDCVK